MAKPPRLKRGDTVGIVSPSWAGAGAHPQRVQKGIAYLESLGFRVRIAPHALGKPGLLTEAPASRASDLHDLFLDDSVRAIVATKGGDHTCELLPLLDYGLIRAHPKIVMGYSDISVLNVAIWKETGLTTFNGPMLLPELAEHPRLLEYTERSLLATLCSASPPGCIEPATWWTEEWVDWGLADHQLAPRSGRGSDGWTWLREGRSEGVLLGGCLESLQHLRGTRFWPDWSGSILFLETSEQAPSPAWVDAILVDYDNMGILRKLRGLLFGRPMRYSDPQRRELREVIIRRTQAYGFPVVADMDFGHTAPQFVLPVGCKARIDSGDRSFAIIEPAVA